MNRLLKCGKHFKRKETTSEIRNRVLKLANTQDCGILPPPMDAQKALDELCRYILGDDWYIVSPIHTAQVNTEIVYEIECKLRHWKAKQR